MTNDSFVGKFIKGKEVTEAHSNGVTVNFSLSDGTYETAPIVNGKVVVEFDDVVPSTEVDDTATIENEDIQEVETKHELGFYKTLQPIPYFDEEGTELGKSEVGSVQEVPVELGDAWVEDGLAEKVEEPKDQGLAGKIKNAIGIK